MRQYPSNFSHNRHSKASITNSWDTILLFEHTPHIPVNGVNTDTTAIIYTGKYFTLWNADSEDDLLVPIYYSAQANGTIISPYSVQKYYNKIYRGFHLFCDYNNKTVHLQFYNWDGINHSIFNAFSENNLWYHNTI